VETAVDDVANENRDYNLGKSAGRQQIYSQDKVINDLEEALQLRHAQRDLARKVEHSLENSVDLGKRPTAKLSQKSESTTDLHTSMSKSEKAAKPQEKNTAMQLLRMYTFKEKPQNILSAKLANRFSALAPQLLANCIEQ